jgi:hypothetical protein
MIFLRLPRACRMAKLSRVTAVSRFWMIGMNCCCQSQSKKIETRSMRNANIDRRSVPGLIGALLTPAHARAANYPSRPIKIIVQY